MEKENSYSKRVYSISKNILENLKSKYAIENTKSIHNVLYGLYKFLIGQYKAEDSNYAVPFFDLESVKDSELEKLFIFYLDRIRNVNCETDVRNIKSNFYKNDLALKTELINEVMKLAEEENNVHVIHGKNNLEFYKDYYAYYQQTIRFNISKWEEEYIKFLDQKTLKVSLQQILAFRHLAFKKTFSSCECKEIEDDFTFWVNHYRTTLYIDISCWIVLQIVTNSLTNKKFNIKVDSIRQLCKELDNFSREIESVKLSENIFLSYSELLLYSIFRTQFLLNTDLIKELEGKCKPVPAEYSVLTDDGKSKVLLPSERARVYLEGKAQDKRTFNKNLEMCKKFISLYNEKTNRHLQENDLTLKAIYRQLILDDTVKYRRKSKTMISQFIKNGDFENLNEYYFINEKINLGIYREKGLLEEYIVKNEFQEKLYILVNVLLTRLKPSDILHDAEKFFGKVFSMLEETIVKDEKSSSVAINDINDFLSSMEFCFLEEPQPEKM